MSAPTAIPEVEAPRAGRQRNEECDVLILEATLDQIAAKGYAGFTVSAVIEQAGVSSATLYRRWATKPELVVAAVSMLLPEPIDTDTGSLRGDLEAFVGHVAASIGRHREDVADALTFEKRRNPELDEMFRARFLQPRLDDLGGILRRAKGRGEIGKAPAVDTALSLVVGPLHHRAFYLGEPLTPAFLRTVVTTAVRALTP